jgi:hypothetical protein
LLLNQQQFVFSSTCSEKGGNAKESSKEQNKWSTIDISDELQNIGKVAFLFHTILDKEKLDVIDLKALLQCVDKHPHIMSVLGTGVSIVLLKQSLSSHDSVNRIKKEYKDLLETNLNAFKHLDAYKNHMETRSAQIRDQIVATKQQEWYMGCLKTIVSAIFAWIGYFTNNLILKIGMFAANGGAGVAAIINFYNCYELAQLINRLQQNGYIV